MMTTYDFVEGGGRNIANIVEKIAIRAEFGYNSDRHVSRIVQCDADELDDVFVFEIAEQT